MSKALNAHDSWDFELEYEHLLEGNLLPQARLSLLYFLLPKLLKGKHKKREPIIVIV